MNKENLDHSNSLCDLAARIQREHELCTAAVKRGCEHAINAGRLLLEAKPRIGPGRWLPWLKEHCRVSARTAQVYMQLAKLAPDAQRVADLPLRRAALQLQRLDRDAQRLAQREEEFRREEPEERRAAIMDVAMRAVLDQLDRLIRPAAEPVPVTVVRIVHDQLDHLDETRRVAADLIDQLLFAAMEVGVSIERLFEAFRRRMAVTGETTSQHSGRSAIAWRISCREPPLTAIRHCRI